MRDFAEPTTVERFEGKQDQKQGNAGPRREIHDKRRGAGTITTGMALDVTVTTAVIFASMTVAITTTTFARALQKRKTFLRSMFSRLIT